MGTTPITLKTQLYPCPDGGKMCNHQAAAASCDEKSRHSCSWFPFLGLPALLGHQAACLGELGHFFNSNLQILCKSPYRVFSCGLKLLFVLFKTLLCDLLETCFWKACYRSSAIRSTSQPPQQKLKPVVCFLKMFLVILLHFSVLPPPHSGFQHWEANVPHMN